MRQRIGTYITQNSPGEAYKAYVPPSLPPNPALDLLQLEAPLKQATKALAALKKNAKSIPNTTLFLYTYIQKEALLSSQIEGTQTSFSDLILFEQQQEPNVTVDDVEEVSNYIKAIQHGLKRLKKGFPLCLRLLCEIHAILLAGTRGANKMAGEFRRTQNWIGGTRPGTALYVPPPVAHMLACLDRLESFLHDETLPTLLRAGLAHVQFESIHPFLDGNGRLGRLLITLMLCEGKLLNSPILYLSLYLKQHRKVYYALLQEVRTTGNWEAWLIFFLEGVTTTSNQATKATQDIDRLFRADQEKINRLGRSRFTCDQIFTYLKRLPQASVAVIVKQLAITPPTARNALNKLLEAGILEEITEKKRDRVYVYRKYLDILEEGTEPFAPKQRGQERSAPLLGVVPELHHTTMAF